VLFLTRSVAALSVVVAGSVLALSLIQPVAPPDLPPDKQVIDMHVHVAGLGQGCDNCFVSPEIQDSYKFAWYLRAFGTSARDMHAHGDGVVVERLREYIRSSRWVAQVVVLALDGVINADGELDRDATQVYVPNDYVAELAAGDSALLFGASINPYRTDAVERLQHASDNGAVLVKWIPAIMAIDPADPRLDRFYARLAALGLPLLVHVGDENAFHHADNRLGDPLRLKRPLDLGVTVIAAHIATTGDSEGVENFERLLTMFADHPNLYTEISSLTQINKLGYLKRALAVSGLDQRMLYGSDWPLQFFPLVWAGWHTGSAPVAQLRFAAQLDNPFDRDIALKSALGVPASVFTRSGLKLVHEREKL
jgi:predicted TIM-barrel fold metal-dependent hydrolase